jgi:hypothetical protein
MATISNTPRPGYVWDSTDNVWYPIGVGGHGHTDYITQATAVNPTIIDAKGDIITATAADTPARLAVGNNGETLVADSSATTGLRWQGDYAAGKNKVINGDMNIWQRGTTFTSPAAGAFTADRWAYVKDGTGTCTVSQQTFTPGAAPVAGYESTFFLRNAGTALGNSNDFDIRQRIEDVRTLAGQTVTVSFYAKADSARTLTLFVGQDFGSGGSSTVYPLSGQTYTLSTAWTRYSTTFTMTSVSGKTIGTSSSVFLLFRNAASATLVFDLWGVQLEAGSVATAFQTATGTIQGELAACQRYYFRTVADNSNSYAPVGGQGVSVTATTANIYLTLPVQMRVNPTSVGFANLCISDLVNYNLAVSTLAGGQITTRVVSLDATHTTGATANRPAFLRANNSAAGYLEVSAEL